MSVAHSLESNSDIINQKSRRGVAVTSEVLILNKRAVVIGADSAVTTSGGDHPRYSKSANKIFEISKAGNVAVAIYGGAAIDTVPWEVILRLFRNQLGDVVFSRLSEYSSALYQFLSANEKIFPAELRKKWIQSQFDDAVKVVIREAQQNSQNLSDPTLDPVERTQIWSAEADRIRQLLLGYGVAAPLTQAALDEILNDLDPWIQRAQEQIDAAGTLSGVNAGELAELAHRVRYVLPHWILGKTGVVIAGYGDDQIFPTYEQLDFHGHIGDELYYKEVDRFEVTHHSIAMLKPLAQSSMIEMFTDGFSPSLEKIIQEQSDCAISEVFSKINQAGVVVSPAQAESIKAECLKEFMFRWKKKNWEENFHPLLNVLQSLSIQEMAHLAESLLGLQSLKERVTSPSESVGGPIDVAVITKSEGLVWIKRKQFFDPSLNMRYAARLERSFD
ncbi:radical SAM protein [Comamonas aquatica]|uniref:hypothetical protein n=1 Tax=Comamonas aquatica TaxID=225991 RepID=UPI002448DA30|nr:hypothetical protein [Comamonas aquatica]MDH0373641.1 radical SAM protein [Comamonas aquatica]